MICNVCNQHKKLAIRQFFNIELVTEDLVPCFRFQLLFTIRGPIHFLLTLPSVVSRLGVELQ